MQCSKREIQLLQASIVAHRMSFTTDVDIVNEEHMQEPSSNAKHQNCFDVAVRHGLVCYFPNTRWRHKKKKTETETNRYRDWRSCQLRSHSSRVPPAPFAPDAEGRQQRQVHLEPMWTQNNRWTCRRLLFGAVRNSDQSPCACLQQETNAVSTNTRYVLLHISAVAMKPSQTNSKCNA